jgi:hypothetical protein
MTDMGVYLDSKGNIKKTAKTGTIVKLDLNLSIAIMSSQKKSPCFLASYFSMSIPKSPRGLVISMKAAIA